MNLNIKFRNHGDEVRFKILRHLRLLRTSIFNQRRTDIAYHIQDVHRSSESPNQWEVQ